MDKNDTIYNSYEIEHDTIKKNIKNLHIYNGTFTTLFAATVGLGAICLENNLWFTFGATICLDAIITREIVNRYNELKQLRTKEERLKEYEKKGPSAMREGLIRLELEEMFKHHDWKNEEEKERELQEIIDYQEQQEKDDNEYDIDEESCKKRI